MKKTIIGVTVFVVLVTTAVSNAGLVAQWDFDESNGSTVLDDSVGTADGVVGEGVSFVASGAGVGGSGFGSAGDFSATTTNYVDLGSPDVLDLGTGDFTITGWLKAPNVSTNPSLYYFLLENGEHNVGGVNLLLGRSDRSYRGKFIFDFKGLDSNISIMSDYRIDNGSWHWFAAVASSGTINMYVDGVLQTASAAYGTNTTATASEAYIAKIGENYNGLLDDMRVYNTALTGTLDGSTLTGGDLYDVWQVPEPMTLLLLGMGGCTLMLRKK